MGEYYIAKCDTCRMKFRPSLMKWREIAMSRADLMKLGLFLMLHNGHNVHLCGDERDAEEWEYAYANFREQPEEDFDEMREGVPYLPNNETHTPNGSGEWTNR